jgi:hypothetical protein
MGFVDVEVSAWRSRTENITVGVHGNVVIQGSRPVTLTEKSIQNRFLPGSLAGIGRKLVDNAAADRHITTGAGGCGTAAALNRPVEISRGVNRQAVKGMNSIRAAGTAAEVVDDALRNFAVTSGGLV